MHFNPAASVQFIASTFLMYTWLRRHMSIKNEATPSFQPQPQCQILESCQMKVEIRNLVNGLLLQLPPVLDGGGGGGMKHPSAFTPPQMAIREL